LTKEKIETLPFEMYIHSCEEKEYKVDIRKKNYIIKYSVLLENNNLDKISLKRFVMSMVFFRNTFCKDAVMKFFLTDFTIEAQKLLSPIVFDIFVKSKEGEIGEYKDYYSFSLEIYNMVNRKHAINKNWEEIKEELPQVI
jgi:hypothetical protein